MSHSTFLGIVKWFSPRKGYGFLLDQETGEEIFVHYSAIKAQGYRKLEKGSLVRFQKILCEKGPRAMEVLELEPGTDSLRELAPGGSNSSFPGWGAEG